MTYREYRRRQGACGQAARGLVVCASVLSLLACTPIVRTHGYRLDEVVIGQIRPGTSSREEVLGLLGSPSTQATLDGNTWYYISQTSERFTFYQENVVDQTVVAITFDDLGVVQEIARHDLADATEIAFVDRETPTSGNELSVWEQFVGNIGRFNPEGQ